MLSELVCRSAAETEQAGEHLAQSLRAGDVIALFGGMGMGKTQFVRGLARGLGVSGTVSSPTFALVHTYNGRVTLYHFDMYRIETWTDLESTGFFDYLDAGGICAVEWSENIEAALPENAIRVHIAPGETENIRCISIQKPEQRSRSDENTGH